MTEAELKREILRIAYAAGWHVYHVPATTVRGSQGRGYPDLTLARRGVVLWMELKQEGQPLRPEQKAWRDTLPVGRCLTIYPSDLDTGYLVRLLG